MHLATATRWDESRRDALANTLARHPGERAADLSARATAAIDALARHWIRARRRACADMSTRALSRARYRSLGACHERALAALDELITETARSSDAETLERVPLAAARVHEQLLRCPLDAPARSLDEAPDHAFDDALARAVVDLTLGRGDAAEARVAPLQRDYDPSRTPREQDLALRSLSIDLSYEKGRPNADEQARELLSRVEALEQTMDEDRHPGELGSLPLYAVRAARVLAEHTDDPAAALELRRAAVERARALRSLPVSRERGLALFELADQLRQQGEFAEARARYEQSIDALAGFDLTCQAEAAAPDRARAHEGLGRALAHLGEHERALAQHRTARALRVASLGPKHPAVASSEHYAGAALEAMRRLPQAEAAYRRALSLRMRALAAHPDTARSYNNLARALYYQRRFEESLEIHREALRIRLSLLGENHPDTATSYNNIGAVHRALGDNQRALKNFERGLAIRRATVGEDHPYTAVSLNNIASILELEDPRADPAAQRAALTRALELHRAALAIRERFFGPVHAETARSDHNLGRLLARLGDHEAARERLQRALATRESLLGPGHPETRSSRDALAELDALAAPKKPPGAPDLQELTAPEVRSKPPK